MGDTSCKITTEQFDEELKNQLEELSVGALLEIPGVYEAVSEELNNDVLDAIDKAERR